jgi:hypothetical protein
MGEESCLRVDTHLLDATVFFSFFRVDNPGGRCYSLSRHGADKGPCVGTLDSLQRMDLSHDVV